MFKKLFAYFKARKEEKIRERITIELCKQGAFQNPSSRGSVEYFVNYILTGVVK